MLKKLVNLIKREEVIIGAIFMFFALGFNMYRVQCDGSLYYTFLESLFQPQRLIIPGQPGFHQSGCAYFNAPFYALALFIEKILKLSFDFKGITIRSVFINLSSNFYMLLSIYLCVRILKKLNFRHVFISVLSVLFSTSAFVVSVITPSFNHTADIFVTTLLVYFFLYSQDEKPVKVFWLGSLIVIATLVRYLDLAFIAPFVAYYLATRQYVRLKYFFTGFICTIWILPLLFYVYNGSVLRPFINSDYVFKALDIRSLWPRHALKYLIHPLHGLFIWSPVTVLSALGLTLMPKAKEKTGFLFLGMWFSIVCGYGFFHDWYAGWSFSNRYLTGLFPIYIIGLAAFLEKYGKKIILPAVILTLYSIFLFFNWYFSVMNGAWGTPLDMLECWIKGESLGFPGKINLSIFLERIYQTCRFKYIFYLFK